MILPELTLCLALRNLCLIGYHDESWSLLETAAHLRHEWACDSTSATDFQWCWGRNVTDGTLLHCNDLKFQGSELRNFLFLKIRHLFGHCVLMLQGYIATCGLEGHSTACFCRQRWTLSFLFILLPLFAMHCILFCFCYILTYICIFILLIKNLNPPFFLLMSIY